MNNKIFFIYSPGGDSDSPASDELSKKAEQKVEEEGTERHHPTFWEKVKKMLQEWSNDDAAQLADDDTKV